MPPYTTLPTPEGFINISYSPMSPPNWGIVAAEFHVFVYSNVRIALKALMQASTTIQAQRLERGSAELPEEELRRRDELERRALDRASRIKEVAELDAFRRRAAVRHYGRVPSPLLDVSTSPEVAAFFATGGGSAAPVPAQVGMLWAIDLNFVGELFVLKTSTVPGGEKTLLTEERGRWGDNKQMFEDYGILPSRLEIASVELPFDRPRAQHARFFSITGEQGSALPLKTELTWWSIIERQAYMCAFIQDGRQYENESHNITASALLPEHEPLAVTLGQT